MFEMEHISEQVHTVTLQHGSSCELRSILLVITLRGAISISIIVIRLIIIIIIDIHRIGFINGIGGVVRGGFSYIRDNSKNNGGALEPVVMMGGRWFRS